MNCCSNHLKKITAVVSLVYGNIFKSTSKNSLAIHIHCLQIIINKTLKSSLMIKKWSSMEDCFEEEELSSLLY